MREKTRQLIESGLRALILLGFAVLLYRLVDSGKIVYYVNPKYAVLVKGAALTLFVMFLAQVFRTARRDHACGGHGLPGGGKWGYIAFMVPLLMAYFLPDAPLDAGMAANKRPVFNARIAAPAAGPPAAQPEGAGSVAPGTDRPAGTARPSPVGELRKASIIDVSDDNFNLVMSEIYLFPDEYTGKGITMLGFVDRDESFLPNQFGLVRYVVTCCSADATLGGMICEYNHAAGLKKGAWITVSGTIQKGWYEQRILPVIKVTSHKEVEAPRSPYIYQ